MKDVDITRKFGIPSRTIQDWKNTDKGNWRFKVYNFLKKGDFNLYKFKQSLSLKNIVDVNDDGLLEDYPQFGEFEKHKRIGIFTKEM